MLLTAGSHSSPLFYQFHQLDPTVSYHEGRNALWKKWKQMFSIKAKFLRQFFLHLMVFVNSAPPYSCFRWQVTGQWCPISIGLRGKTPLKVNLWYKPSRKKVCLKALYNNFLFCKSNTQFGVFKRKTTASLDVFRPPTVFYIFCCNFSIAEMVSSHFWNFRPFFSVYLGFRAFT